MDRFQDLRAFVQVVESGNLTRAAAALQVATSAVSRRIKDLEARLGTQLLQRTTRQMRLTASGEVFHARARDILQALEEAESEAGDSAKALAGPLRIAAPLSLGRIYLGATLLDFACEHPALELDIDLSDRFVDLVAEGHDLAIRIGNLGDSSLIARKLAEVRLIVVASPSFWDTHGLPTSPEDLNGLPVVCYTGANDRLDAWDYTAPDGVKGTVFGRSVLRSTNGELLREASIRGLGMALQPSFIVRDAVVRGDLVPVLSEHHWPTVSIHAVYPQTRHVSARARAFIDFVRARIGSRPAWEDFLQGRANT